MPSFEGHVALFHRYHQRGRMYLMGSRSDVGLPTAEPPASQPREQPVSVPGSRVGLVVLLAILLFLVHPFSWSVSTPALWSPAVGLGLLVVAWFGSLRAGFALLGAGILLLARHALRGGDDVAASLAWVAVEAVLGVVVPLGAWWLYHSAASGSQRLAEPRSAMLFVFLTAGVSCAGSATIRTTLALLLSLPGASELPWHSAFLGHWLSDALAMLVLVPPGLVLLTPVLANWGLISTESPHRGDEASPFLADSDLTWSWGDWLEIVGLTIGATTLCLLLTGLHRRGELLGWHFWGVQLLLIVWASLRQGLPGGTVVAGVAAAFCLTAGTVGNSIGFDDPVFRLLLQAHLLAQCAAAVLIASSASWVRRNESAYRQVAAHIPVVIYRARLLATSVDHAVVIEGPRDPRDEQLGDTSRVGDGEKNPPPLISPDLAEVTLVSAASAALLGCRPEELLGEYTRWIALVHPDDREVLLAALGQLERQDQPVACEYRLAGGHPGAVRRTRWLRDTLAPRRDRNGRLVGWEGIVSDISEQRVLADDLRRTTSLFNALVANLPTGVFFIQGTHGQPILVNARARQLLGQREDLSAGLEHFSRVYRLFRPDGTLYPSEELPVYLALKEGRSSMRDDIVVHRADGKRVPLVTWAAPIKLGGPGGHDAAVWVLEDLTALHQAEAARKDSEGRLRAVLDTMAEGLIVLDSRGRIVTTNAASCALFESSPDKLRGRTLADLGWRYQREGGEALSVAEHPAVVALEGGRPVRNVLVGVQPNEGSPEDRMARLTVRWVLVNAMPLVSARGQRPAGVVVTFSDLSAYVQARETIRVSEERYRQFVETLPLMLLQGGRDRRLSYTNPATKQITGYALEEIADYESWSSLVHSDDLSESLGVIDTALNGGIGRGEVRYRARDGSEKVSFFTSQPRFQDGEVIGFTILAVDVTRERRLESELARAQSMELIGRLSSGVAHDFNNLLAVVLNLTELAHEHLPADHPATASLSRISAAVEQAAGLTGQLLALARQRPGTLRPVEVNALARRTLELLGATLPSAIRLESELCAGELLIQGDETQVQQVLMNLCLNARDALPDGGTLSVRTRFDAGESWPAVRLTVEDSGTGMNESIRARIFEPFYSTKEHGTGLGLAVVQQIVESFRGSIEVFSQPGLGTRFVIRWPALSPVVTGGEK